MDPRDFWQFSTRFVGNPNISPVEARTAISRAYYGAFNYAVNALESMNAAVLRNASAHIETYRLFLMSGNGDLVVAGGHLDDLHGLRNRADYKLSPNVSVESQSSAMTAVMNAGLIFSSIDAVLNDPARRASASADIRAIYQQVTNRPPP